MAKQPVTTTPRKPAKAEAAPAKPAAVKTETAPAETPAAKTEAPAAGGAKKAAAPARPISYFSAVASEDYRAGWDSIFGAKKKAPGGKPARTAAVKDDNALPLTLTLDAEDIDAATRKRLDAVLRREAKKRGLNYDKLAGNGQVTWHVTCRISKG